MPARGWNYLSMNFLLEQLGKVGFQWQMGLFNFVNFLIIFWILKRFFFKPVLATINDRQQKAKEAVENFDRAKTEVGMAQKKSQEIIDNAKVDANKAIARAAEDAKEAGEKLKEKAKSEIELLVKQAKKNIEIDKKEMKEEIQKETASIVVAAVEKIIDTKLDEKKDGELINKALEGLK